MKKIDFSKIEIFTGVGHKTCIVQDIREVFADAMYSHGVGLRHHALALKIYNSRGAEEYDDNEVECIRLFTESYCSPSLIDAIKHLIE